LHRPVTLCGLRQKFCFSVLLLKEQWPWLMTCSGRVGKPTRVDALARACHTISSLIAPSKKSKRDSINTGCTSASPAGRGSRQQSVFATAPGRGGDAGDGASWVLDPVVKDGGAGFVLHPRPAPPRLQMQELPPPLYRPPLHSKNRKSPENAEFRYGRSVFMARWRGAIFTYITPQTSI